MLIEKFGEYESPTHVNPCPSNGFLDVYRQRGGGGKNTPQTYLEF